jgi:hypothetical protein
MACLGQSRFEGRNSRQAARAAGSSSDPSASPKARIAFRNSSSVASVSNFLKKRTANALCALAKLIPFALAPYGFKIDRPAATAGFAGHHVLERSSLFLSFTLLAPLGSKAENDNGL